MMEARRLEMPGFIRRLCITTFVVAALIALFMARADWRAAVTFAVASLWSLLMVLSWVLLTVWMLGNPPGKALRLTLVITAKVLFLYVGGFLLLRWAAPLSKAQAGALIGGLLLVFVVALLKSVGAQITGRDPLSEHGRPISPPDAKDGK